MTDRENIFKKIKGNCVDLIMTDRADHCCHHEDNCEIDCCPQMKKIMREEAHRKREEAQCPTCGSIVAPHEITPKPPSFFMGMFLGIIGALSCVGGIYLFFKIFGLPPALKLHILNYWI